MMEGGQVDDSGVVEVMAGGDGDEPCSEDTVNQIIQMLQQEGQITEDTHTIMVHTPNGGPTLRVQIQQVENANQQQQPQQQQQLALGAEETNDDLVYIGETGQQQQQPQFQQNFTDQQSMSDAQMLLDLPQDAGNLMQNSNNNEFQTIMGTNNIGQVQQQQQFVPNNMGSNYSTPQDNILPRSNQNAGLSATNSYMPNIGNDLSSSYVANAAGNNNNHQGNVYGNNPTFSNNSNIQMESSSFSNNNNNSFVSSNSFMNNNSQQMMNSGNVQINLQNGVGMSFDTANIVPVLGSSSTVNSYNSIGSNTFNNSNSFSKPSYNRSSLETNSYISQNKRKGFMGNKSNNSFMQNNNGYVQTISNKSCNRFQDKFTDIKSSHIMVDGKVIIKIDTCFNDLIIEKTLPPGSIKIKTTTGPSRSKHGFKCSQCKAYFVTENNLFVHAKGGCIGNKNKDRNSTQCNYCNLKFPTKQRTIDHLKICPSNNKGGSKHKPFESSRMGGRKQPITQTVDIEINSDDDEVSALTQEKNIVYDDDDDIDIDLAADTDELETSIAKVSQKYLGPVLTDGKYKCRDCDRTFTKEAQYKRHIGACTNAPLNAQRIDIEKAVPERKVGRGRPRKNGLSAAAKADTLYKRPGAIKATKPSNKVVRRAVPTSKANEYLIDDFDFVNPPMSKKTSAAALKKSNANIMNMLDENLGGGSINDDADKLSESFLDCLTSFPDDTEKSPAKVGVTLCGLCVRHMDSPGKLSSHITTVHAKDVVNMHSILNNNTEFATHKCPLCDKHFISFEAVKEHIVVTHLDSLQDTLKNLRINSLDLPCPWCPHKSMSKELFQQHLASQHTEQFPETALVVPKPEKLDSWSLKAYSTRVASKRETSNTRLCLTCGFVFDKPEDFDAHYKACIKKVEGVKGDEETCSKEVVNLEEFTETNDEENKVIDIPSDVVVGDVQTNESESIENKADCKTYRCNFKSCELPFSTLAEMLGHVAQSHNTEEGREGRMFPSLALFHAWLEQEETRCGVKYVCAGVSNRRAGYATSSYICPNYPTSPSFSADKCCFSRMHVRVRWHKSKLDYSSVTKVLHFNNHHHNLPECPVKIEDINTEKSEIVDKFLGNPPKEVKTEDESSEIVEDSAGSTEKLSSETNTQNVHAEIEVAKSPEKVITPEDNNLGIEEVEAAIAIEDVLEHTSIEIDAVLDPLGSDATTTSITDVTTVPEKKKTSSVLTNGKKRHRNSELEDEEPIKETKIKSSPVLPASKKRKTAGFESRSIKRELKEAEMKALEVEPPRKKSPAVIKKAAGRKPSKKAAAARRKGAAKRKSAQQAATKQETVEYVLPASMAEWSKLFEMTQDQITKDTLKPGEREEAKALMKLEHSIGELELEEQVKIFHKVCNIANIQIG